MLNTFCECELRQIPFLVEFLIKKDNWEGKVVGGEGDHIFVFQVICGHIVNVQLTNIYIFFLPHITRAVMHENC